MVGSSRTRNKSEESKEEVLWGLRAEKNLDRYYEVKQFLKVHSGKPYQERG